MSAPVDLKIPLVLRHPPRSLGRFNTGSVSLVKRSLPLFLSSRSNRYEPRAHRVRRAALYAWDDGRSTINVDFWCGGSGGTRLGRLLAVPPDGVAICGTCEGRAVGAGWPGIAILQQRYELAYSPREGRAPAAASREATA